MTMKLETVNHDNKIIQMHELQDGELGRTTDSEANIVLAIIHSSTKLYLILDNHEGTNSYLGEACNVPVIRLNPQEVISMKFSNGDIQ